MPKAPLSVGTPTEGSADVHAPLPVLAPRNGPAGNIPSAGDLINGSSGSGGYTQNSGETDVGDVAGYPQVDIEGGSLGGNGSIPGDVIIGPGGVMSPGNSPGEIQVGGNAQYGNLKIEIAGPTAHDVVDVAGTAKFVAKSTVTFKFIYDYVPVDGLDVEFLRAGALEGLDYITYAIAGTLPVGFHYQVYVDGESDMHVRFYANGSTSRPGEYAHQILYDGQVPEPPSTALALLGLTLLGWQLRRPRRPVPIT